VRLYESHGFGRGGAMSPPAMQKSEMHPIKTLVFTDNENDIY